MKERENNTESELSVKARCFRHDSRGKEKTMSTPHNRAEKGAFAETVLMPGDPLRAKYLAENYLENAELVTDVRNMLGYTGTYKGKRLSVMGGGMGMPSLGIYVHALYSFYDVRNVIRIGSAGALVPECQVRDIVLAEGACTDSSWAAHYGIKGSFAPIADFGLLSKAYNEANEKGIQVKVGNVLSTDVFYAEGEEPNAAWIKMGVLAVEMETAALYMEAARLGRKALSILTISDELYSGRELPAEERQKGFGQMMELALSLV